MSPDSEAILSSARRAALDLVDPAADEVFKLHVTMHNNGRGAILAADIVAKAYREACDAAANRIAEIRGSSAPELADGLQASLQDLQPVFAEILTGRNWAGGWSDRAERELKSKLSGTLEGTISDLKLGIAGGANVDKSKSRMIHIDNRGGSGQFAVDSNDARQSVGRDLRNDASVNDLSEIAELVAQLREALASGDVPQAIGDELGDATAAIERELEQPQPNRGRLKRLLSALGKFTQEVSAAAIGHTIAGLILAGQHISG